jgi:DNA polymerase-3 subunit epsilon
MLGQLKLCRSLAVLDLETTGINPRTDRIIEISILIVRPDRRTKHHTRRLNPGVSIPPEATAVHGITDADVADAPRFADVADEVVALLEGCDLCGFNLKRFDLPLLYKEFTRAGRSFVLEGRALIDALEIFHTYEPRDLAAAVRFYLGREHRGGHAAATDALATAEVVDAMLARYADLPRDAAGLHAHFKDPAAVDAAGFFTRVSGEVRFAKGKHRGQPLDFVARTCPDYLEWMLGQDFFPDTKEVARTALRRVRPAARSS